jgi:hypothetical protein
MEMLYPAPYQGDQDDNELETLAKYLISLKDEKILLYRQALLAGEGGFFIGRCS